MTDFNGLVETSNVSYIRIGLLYVCTQLTKGRQKRP